MVAGNSVQDNNLPIFDRFGNAVDPGVGYARGRILSSPIKEAKRCQHAIEIITQRAELKDKRNFFNFTGLNRDFHFGQEQQHMGEEWVGGSLFKDRLTKIALEHMGGNGRDHRVGLFNRATAGIIATCLALVKPHSIVLSIVPRTRSHPSIDRGIFLANARKIELWDANHIKTVLNAENISLVIITGVSSELDIIDETILRESIGLCKNRGIPSFLDDAYGARLRPILYGQPKTLETGVDIGITSCDKGGLGGPRAGLIAGRTDLVDLINAKAGELGLECRTPISLGIYQSLKHFRPELLQKEFELGRQIGDRLQSRYGTQKVKKAALGAVISEEDAMEIVSSLGGSSARDYVPAEITTAIGMFLLEQYGIISVNALGQPGARVSLRFKPDPAEVHRFGGIDALIDALDSAFAHIAHQCGSPEAMRNLILGEAEHP